jgi:hypothetical protein
VALICRGAGRSGDKVSGDDAGKTATSVAFFGQGATKAKGEDTGPPLSDFCALAFFLVRARRPFPLCADSFCCSQDVYKNVFIIVRLGVVFLFVQACCCFLMPVVLSSGRLLLLFGLAVGLFFVVVSCSFFCDPPFVDAE